MHQPNGDFVVVRCPTIYENLLTSQFKLSLVCYFYLDIGDALKWRNLKKSLILKAGEIAVTTPYEQHALVGVTNCKLLVFTKGPRGGKEYETDTFRLKNPLVK